MATTITFPGPGGEAHPATTAALHFVGPKGLAVATNPAGTTVVLTQGEAGFTLFGDVAVARHVCKLGGAYGVDADGQSLIEQWVDTAIAVAAVGAAPTDLLTALDSHIATRSYFAGYDLSLADIALATTLQALVEPGAWAAHHHLNRWFGLCTELLGLGAAGAGAGAGSSSKPSTAAKGAPKAAGAPSAPAAAGGKGDKPKGGRPDVIPPRGAGKAAAKPAGGAAAAAAEKKTTSAGAEGTTGLLPPLPDAVHGAVVTRFPPEPSGYLHLGHVKAVMLNEHYARYYGGKLLIRFDDTNPSKESEEYEQSIIDDLGKLGIVGDMVSHTSDFFDTIAEFARQMIREGNAYMDNTPVEEMRKERGDMVESKCRSQDPASALALFEKLWTGEDSTYCMRARIDMKSLNGCLRDPVMFRFNADPHHITGTKYKAYPTYDLACPIVDSIEGVTHAMRTLEYRDRDAQYEWIQKALRLRRVHIIEFSRLNFQFTLLSKRKLTWFVDNGVVDGWMDPRFPTMQGMLRRGMSVANLREFMISQGASKRVVDMEWDKFWSTNTRFWDPTAGRYNAISTEGAVELVLTGGEGLPSGVEGRTLALHDKNPALGDKVMQFASSLWLEADDANDCVEGEEITLMRWGNAIITALHKDPAGRVVKAEGTLNLAGDFKKTKKKLTWVAKTGDTVAVSLVEFDFLISKSKIEEGEDFTKYINPNSRAEMQAIGESSLRNLNENDVIQIMRRGLFRCERPYRGAHAPLVLFKIPDGKAKAMSTLSTKLAHR